MNLINENEEKEQVEKKKKTLKIIIGVIVALVFIAIAIVVFSTIKNKNTLKLQVNDKSASIPDGLFLMSDSKNLAMENGQIYISVRKLVSVLGGGIEYYNDEYKNKGEDTTKCYIKTSNEYTSFLSNSSQIYKAVVYDEPQETGNTSNNITNQSSSKKNNEEKQKITEYEYFNIENGVRYINGEIYASQDAIKLGFNVIISYDQSQKQVKIYTLDAIETKVANVVKLAVIGDDCSYTNKKLLKYGLVLIRNNDGDYGIANYNNYQEGNYLVSCKYSNIRFCESTSTIVVTTSYDGKQGILKLDLVNKDKADTLIEPRYQVIKQMDESLDLYLIKENGRYGIIDISGDNINVVLKSEYQQIGIDGDYLYSDMDNKYVINDKYIPVKIDDKWGIVSIQGKLLISPQYQGIGCNLGETGSGDGVIILPKLVNGVDAIVFLTTVQEQTKLYSMVNVQTGAKIGIEANEIYSKYEDNQRNYYLKINVNGAVQKNLNIYNLFGSKAEDVTNTDEIENSKNNNTINDINNNINNNINNSVDNSVNNNLNNTINTNATNDITNDSKNVNTNNVSETNVTQTLRNGVIQ